MRHCVGHDLGHERNASRGCQDFGVTDSGSVSSRESIGALSPDSPSRPSVMSWAPVRHGTERLTVVGGRSPPGRAGGTLERCTTIHLSRGTRPRADVVHGFVLPVRRPARAWWVLAAVAASGLQGETITVEAEELVVRLFRREGRSLVRLARLFVDDRDAAEDLVQEAFLRLARHAGRSNRATGACLSAFDRVEPRPRPQPPGTRLAASPCRTGREVDVAADAIDHSCDPKNMSGCSTRSAGYRARQRDCITLRYFEELPSIRSPSPGVSANSVKTHLRRAMAALDRTLGRAMNSTMEARLIAAFADARTGRAREPRSVRKGSTAASKRHTNAADTGSRLARCISRFVARQRRPRARTIRHRQQENHHALVGHRTDHQHRARRTRRRARPVHQTFRPRRTQPMCSGPIRGPARATSCSPTSPTT